MKEQDTLPQSNGSEIAVVGLAGRYPGAQNVAEFWENLRDGVESISTFSDHELEASGIDRQQLLDPNFVRANAMLDNVEMFDAEFFGISDRDAAIMDPQHRIFLECAWEALEDAGYNSDTYEGLIGVYAGSGMNTYMIYHLASNPELMANLGMFLVRHLGNDKDFLTTRVSYHLNLKGPSINVQTACSTSLVAVHLACQSLLNGECDMALAGGVTVKFPQKMGYWYRQGEIQSPDGKCRAFDAKSQGTVMGDGVGVVVLKRLAEAIKDGDLIHAIILGSAINNDGAQKVAYMAPGVQGQAEVVAEALAVAGVGAETISYIAAHGTGTPLGDAIEIAALTQAFRNSTQKRGFCSVGSIKPNIGHVDMAAGLASLTATVMAFKHEFLPPSLHFEQPNPEINFANSPFFVNSNLSEWKAGPKPRRAGVNAMGIGGTNAHVVLEEAPQTEPSSPPRPWQLLLLSAKTSSALDTATINLIKHLKSNQEINVADVAYTLQVGRRVFNHRRMVVCNDIGDTIAALESLDPTRVRTANQDHRDRPVVFIFPGEGEMFELMGSDLYQIEPVFREYVDSCSVIIESYLRFDVRKALYPSIGLEAPSTGVVQPIDAENIGINSDNLVIAQCALFVFEYALANLWMSWGLHPQAMYGTGIGEFVAACLAKVFSLDDALALVIAQGLHLQESRNGAKLPGQLQMKRAGSLDASPYDALRLNPGRSNEDIRKVILNPPTIPFLSSKTGTWITIEEATDQNYWYQVSSNNGHLKDGFDEILKQPDWVLLEVGPGLTLNELVETHSEKDLRPVIVASLHPIQAENPGIAATLNALGKLWLSGVQVSWDGFYAKEKRHRLPLPTYPFERKRNWIEPPKKNGTPASGNEELELLESRPILQQNYVSPRNDMERAMAQLWQDLLRVERVGIYDSFFDLGGDSNLAAQLFAQINQIFGKNFPLVTLFEAPTIAELVVVLRRDEWSPSWSPLVPLQTFGPKPPFFCVHAFRGNVLSYYDLAHYMGRERPFYALQAQGLNGEPLRHRRLEAIAAYYIQEIRSVQPEGPYFLGGWCFGGEVALEMAQQLQAQGEKVALVAMIQNPHRDHLKRLSEVPLFRRLSYGLKDSIENEIYYLSGVELKAMPSYATTRVGKIMGILRGKMEKKIEPLLAKLHTRVVRSPFYTLESLAEVNYQAYWNYQPRPYNGRVALFWANKQPLGIYDDPTFGWGKLLGGELEIYTVPGHHHGSFLSKPYVKELADKLMVCLEKANG